jgi:hypothetical protein
MMRIEVEHRDDFMNESIGLDAEAPATMKAVVEVVARLSTYSEREILELVSKGQVGELFPFHPRQQETPADFVAEEDLQEASALPLSREQRGSLVQSSMPAAAQSSSPAATKAAHGLQKKALRSSED